MDRHQSVARFWNWLPGFRAVAETEHLPTAAELAHVTPAALSRTVKLLEQALDRELFHRRGRRLHLNDDGRALLGATRMAMRLVHDAATAIHEQTLEGPVRIAAGGVGQVLALRAVLLAHRRLPGMRPTFLTPDPGTARDQLLRGDLDLVIGSFRVEHEALATELLGYATSAVYCGPSHPLYGRQDVPVEELVRYPFTAPPNGVDGWPAEIERDIQFEADRMAVGVEVCGSTALLAVLPDAFARASPLALHALDQPGLIPRTPVIATRRVPTGADNLTEQLLTVVRQVCGSLEPGRA